jgi:tRNA pseudouridine38-40 synthase
MQRIALGLEYDGSQYSGWQRQNHKPSIQAHLESALSKVADHPVAVVCAGRTDARVHASGQVVHFDTPAVRVPLAWTRGVNAHLPPDIRVNWQAAVTHDFNARHSAVSRSYSYIILNRPIPPGIMRNAVTWVLAPLDATLMQTGADFLVGTHDFNSFRAAQCQAKTSTRTIHSLEIVRKGAHIIVEVTANAFLHHMVRNIVGSLIKVGKGECNPDWIEEVLAGKDRRLAGLTAPPNGLYLVHVGYPEMHGLKTPKQHPWFFQSELTV